MGQNRAKKVAKRKAKKKRHLKVINRPTKPRACGACMECCKHFPVHGLPGYEDRPEGVKPAGEPCMHLTDNEEARCGTYRNRPPVCGAYKCLWLYDGEAKNRTMYADDRPDISGVIFDLAGPEHPACVALKKPVIVARPVREGVWGTDHVKTILDRFVGNGYVVAMIKGRKTYEFLAADPQEAAIVAKVYQGLKDFEVVKAEEQS